MESDLYNQIITLVDRLVEMNTNEADEWLEKILEYLDDYFGAINGDAEDI